jgi:hypothetical protein
VKRRPSVFALALLYALVLGGVAYNVSRGSFDVPTFVYQGF